MPLLGHIEQCLLVETHEYGPIVPRERESLGDNGGQYPLGQGQEGVVVVAVLDGQSGQHVLDGQVLLLCLVVVGELVDV